MCCERHNAKYTDTLCSRSREREEQHGNFSTYISFFSLLNKNEQSWFKLVPRVMITRHALGTTQRTKVGRFSRKGKALVFERIENIFPYSLILITHITKRWFSPRNIITSTDLQPFPRERETLSISLITATRFS